jgi:hypothetical protein
MQKMSGIPGTLYVDIHMCLEQLIARLLGKCGLLGVAIIFVMGGRMYIHG